MSTHSEYGLVCIFGVGWQRKEGKKEKSETFLSNSLGTYGITQQPVVKLHLVAP